MKILYISQYYPPEMGAPAARVSELTRHWADMGHDVTVLTGFPNHPTGILRPEYRAAFRNFVSREMDGKVKVVRTWLLVLPNRKFLERVLNYVSFMVSAAFTGMFLSRADVVIATSPQLLVPLAGWWVSVIHRARYVFEVRDLWPEALVAMGVTCQGSFAMRVLMAMTRFLYRRADKVVVVTPAFREHLLTYWSLPDSKVAVVENGVEPSNFMADGLRDEVRRQLGVNHMTLVSSIGTLGMTYGSDVMLDAIAILQQSHPNIRFLVMGEGADKEQIKLEIERKQLKNVVLHDAVDRALVPRYIAASDICLVLLKNSDFFRTLVPTKMLEFMAAGRPVILNLEGQAQQILEKAKAGRCVAPGDPQALAEAIRSLAGNRELREQYGVNGRAYIQQYLSRRALAELYISILEDHKG